MDLNKYLARTFPDCVSLNLSKAHLYWSRDFIFNALKNVKRITSLRTIRQLLSSDSEPTLQLNSDKSSKVQKKKESRREIIQEILSLVETSGVEELFYMIEQYSDTSNNTNLFINNA